MFFLHATVFLFQLVMPAAFPAAFPAATHGGHNGLACPIEVWRGFCNYMTAGQRERVRQAVQVNARVTPGPCIEARDALLEGLGSGKQAWVFERHAHDDASTGTWVLGETVGFRPASGFGLRLAAFSAADRFTLAWIALHEGAHLAGATEPGANWVANHCAMPSFTTAARG